MSRLTETWVTRATARQRKGRAGRTRPGECYKLYTQKQEEDMEPFPIPEILRVPLESLCLTVKAMREDEDVKVREVFVRNGVVLKGRCVCGDRSYSSEWPLIRLKSRQWRKRGRCLRNSALSMKKAA